MSRDFARAPPPRCRDPLPARLAVCAQGCVRVLARDGEGKTSIITRVLGQLCIYECHARIFAPRVHEQHELDTLVQAAHLFRKDESRVVPAVYNAGLQAWSACAHRLPAKHWWEYEQKYYLGSISNV
jgi:hypothetical protein